MSTARERLLEWIRLRVGLEPFYRDLVVAAIAEAHSAERERLKPWLDHRWKCDVSRAIRFGRKMPPKCNCGFDDLCVEFGWRERT